MSTRSDRRDALITFVVFRGEILAFFRAVRIPGEKEWIPVEPVNNMQPCYAHIGQHGRAMASILRNGKRASPGEYAELLRELTDVCGYNVTVRQYAGRKARKEEP